MQSEEEDFGEDSTDDDESLKESVRDKVTKQSFTEMLEKASSGQELLPIVDLLPNSSQKYDHSIAMNAIIKLIGHHSAFRNNCGPKLKRERRQESQQCTPALLSRIRCS
jgi:hypothetical protein